MLYRDFEMKIVRMGAPGGWKWAVTIDGKERSGSCGDREHAIELAKKFIDRRLALLGLDVGDAHKARRTTC
jgi:hypothetical protein